MTLAGELQIITILLIMVVRAEESTCPDICKCPVLYRADCLNLSLTSVPANLYKEIRFLNASNNHLSEITKSVLSNNVDHLKSLDLSYNKISSIENGAMGNMKELIFLYLSGNEITKINPNVFEYNSRLEYLKLDNNVLLLPSQKHFLNIPSLKSLDISSCNIKTIPEMAFVKLQNLEELRLSHNQLLSLESGVFLPLKHLKSLYISDNLLRELPEDLFLSLKKLEVLDLSKNQLEKLNSAIFAFLENVDLLDLSHNSLKALEVGIFAPMSNLKRLHLHGNKLNHINENQFSDLNNLTVLDLSGNHLAHLHYRIICRLDRLMYLKVTENRLSCDCALWQLWNWSTLKNATMLSTCEKSGFEFSIRGFEELRKNNSCNYTMCELEMDTEFPQEMFVPLYVYAITGFGFILVIIAIIVTVWAVVRYRKEICRKRNGQVSATEYSINTMTYRSGQHAEQLAEIPQNSLQRQLDLQHELHRRHQESLMRNRIHRELSSSLQTLSEREQSNHDIRHSYHEQRLASVMSDENAWFNADTLPSNNRTSVFLPNVSSPKRRESSVRRDKSVSEPRLKGYPKRESNVLEQDTNTPNRGSSVLCPVPRGSLVLDLSSESEVTAETKRL